MSQAGGDQFVGRYFINRWLRQHCDVSLTVRSKGFHVCFIDTLGRISSKAHAQCPGCRHPGDSLPFRKTLEVLSRPGANSGQRLYFTFAERSDSWSHVARSLWKPKVSAHKFVFALSELLYLGCSAIVLITK